MTYVYVIGFLVTAYAIFQQFQISRLKRKVWDAEDKRNFYKKLAQDMLDKDKELDRRSLERRNHLR